VIILQKSEISGPGFINIFMSKEFARNEIKKMILNGVRPPFVGGKKKVVIDFSSPNIAKEMHVGHLR
jgi:arginyl-tRNA synthetase